MILFNTVSKVHKYNQDQGVTQPQEHHLSLGASLWLQEFPSTGIPLSSLWPVSCILGRAQRCEEIPTEAMPWLQKAETFLIRLPLTPLHVEPILGVILDLFPVRTQSSENNKT